MAQYQKVVFKSGRFQILRISDFAAANEPHNLKTSETSLTRATAVLLPFIKFAHYCSHAFLLLSTMPVAKKRRNIDEPEGAPGASPPGPRLAAKVVARPRRSGQDNQFSRTQDAHEEHLNKQVFQMYREQLASDNVPANIVMEVRRLKEQVEEKHSPTIGDVFVTGSNDCVQLGLASEGEVKRLTLVNELVGKDIVHVTCGALSNFVLDRAGCVYSWGTSDKGALARRTDTAADPDTEYKPERVTGFNPSNQAFFRIPASNEDANIVQVAAGGGHVLFLSNNGTCYVAGSYLIDNRAWREEPPPDQPDKDNTKTELYEGAAPKGFREEPRHVYKMPQRVDHVWAGTAMSAARLADGTLVTWGSDQKGELGRGSSEERCEIVLTPKTDAEVVKRLEIMRTDFLIPKAVKYSPSLEQHLVLDVACGQNHMLVVVRESGSTETMVFATGLNQYGQLGLGDETSRNVLTFVSTTSWRKMIAVNLCVSPCHFQVRDSKGKSITSVAAGLFHSMGLDMTGRHIYTWGRADGGHLGITDTIPDSGDFRNQMQKVQFDAEDPDEDLNFKSIAAGEHSCFAVTRTGKLYSWGFGVSGQLGQGRFADQPRVTAVSKFAKEESAFVLEVASGSQHSIVLANREMIKK